MNESTDKNACEESKKLIKCIVPLPAFAYLF